MGVCAMDMLVMICHMVYGCVCYGCAGNDIPYGVWVCVPWICNMMYVCACHGYSSIYMQHGVLVCVPWIYW